MMLCVCVIAPICASVCVCVYICERACVGMFCCVYLCWKDIRQKYSCLSVFVFDCQKNLCRAILCAHTQTII